MLLVRPPLSCVWAAISVIHCPVSCSCTVKYLANILIATLVLHKSVACLGAILPRSIVNCVVIANLAPKTVSNLDVWITAISNLPIVNYTGARKQFTDLWRIFMVFFGSLFAVIFVVIYPFRETERAILFEISAWKCQDEPFAIIKVDSLLKSSWHLQVRHGLW